jgi:hypothetical protein
VSSTGNPAPGESPPKLTLSSEWFLYLYGFTDFKVGKLFTQVPPEFGRLLGQEVANRKSIIALDGVRCQKMELFENER